MKEVMFTNEEFRKDSLAVFERILQGYSKATHLSVWSNQANKLIEKLTHLPTDPFAVRLIELFNYDYLVLSADINSIIKESLLIKDQMEDCQRFVYVKKRYYRLPFLKKMQLKKNRCF